MKKISRAVAAAAVIALALTGCGEPPEVDYEALGWDESWQTVGTVAAVEVPEGFEAAENLDIMSGEGLWYAAWTRGEGEEIENDAGEDAVLYNEQIYLLIERCGSEAKAEAETKLWADIHGDNYDCSEPWSEEHGGVGYTVTTLTAPEDNPFDGGVCASAALGSWAVSVELMYREGFDGGAEETMGEFLDGLHLNLEEEG